MPTIYHTHELEGFKGKTIDDIKYDKDRIYIKFTDGSTINAMALDAFMIQIVIDKK